MILPIFLPFFACGNRCIYCEQQSITGLSLQNGSLNLFIDKQVKAWLSHTNLSDIKEIAYYGGNFGAIEKKIRNFLYQKAHDLGIRNIRYSTRPDTITDELLEEAEKENVCLIELGVQSLDDKVLRENLRPYNREKVFEAIEKISEVTNCGIQMMTGMYLQEQGSIIDDALDISRYNKQNGKGKIKCARIYPTAIFSGTKLAEYYENGKYSLPTFKETILDVGGAYIIFLANNINVIRIGLPPIAEDEKLIATSSHQSIGDIIRTFLLLLYFNILKDSNQKFSTKYSGYKKACREIFTNIFEYNKDSNIIDKIDLNEISKEIMEQYFENNCRFIEGKAAFYAERLESKANNR